jgi:hypothetical protein
MNNNLDPILTKNHSLDNDHNLIIKMHVLDDNNNDTGLIQEINLSDIYSIPCKCGQSKIMCKIINPLCNQYICSDGFQCPDRGEIKVIPKSDKLPKICNSCGKNMNFWGENGCDFKRKN